MGPPTWSSSVRWTAALVLALLMAGCLSSFQSDPKAVQAIAKCRTTPTSEHLLFFGPSMRLQPDFADSGVAAGNAFSSGFLTNDLKEWLSDPVDSGLWLVGDVTLEYWVRSTGTPAPLATNPNSPGQGYQFFNQFGSDRSLQPAYATEYSDVSPAAGKIDHYTETLQMPVGGFVVESGDRVRVLLTDLALDNPLGGGGHDVLFGGGTPSHVRFTAKCWPKLDWSQSQSEESSVSLPANQGLLTGAAPKGFANRQEVQMRIPAHTQRMTITIRQTNDANPAKDDVDLVLLDSSGNAVWSIGSPYSDESGALWLDNIEAAFPDHQVRIQVNSYSGVAYSGTLSVTYASGAQA
jgi:hypothetical protein